MRLSTLQLKIIIISSAIIILGLATYILWPQPVVEPTATVTVTTESAAPVSQLIILFRNQPIMVEPLQLRVIMLEHALGDQGKTTTTVLVIQDDGVTLGQLTFSQIGEIQTLPGYALRLVNAMPDSVQVVVMEQK